MTYDDENTVRVVGRDVPYPPVEHEWPRQSNRGPDPIWEPEQSAHFDDDPRGPADVATPSRITESAHSPQNARRQAYREAYEASNQAHAWAYRVGEWLTSVNDPMADGWWKLVDRLADRADRLSEQLDRL